MLEKQFQFTRMLGQLYTWMTEQGITWVLGDAWRSTDKLQCAHCGRSHSYQELLVHNRKSKTVKSKHCDRCAQDLIIFIENKPQWKGEPYRAVGEKWEALGGRWGGRFGVIPEKYATEIGWDPGHFEL